MYLEMDGGKVRELREARFPEAGIAELARRTGLAPKTLRRVERNGGPVKVDTARSIGGALEVNPRSIARAVWVGRSTGGRPDVKEHELRA